MDDVSAGLAYLIAVFGFDKGFRVVWLLEDDSDAGCVLYFSRSLFYCSGNFITVRFRDLRGDCSHRLEKLPYHIFLIQMVYYHFELGGAIMQTAWYITVPFNILVTVPAWPWILWAGQPVCEKLREVKHYIRAVV